MQISVDIQNEKAFIEDNIIDFVRKRNHSTKHFDLFPNDLQAIQSTGYGRVILNSSAYIFDIVTGEAGMNYLRFFYQDDMDNPIASHPITLDKAYSIYTGIDRVEGGVAIGISSLEVPLQTDVATGWAFGLVQKNKVPQSNLISLYKDNKDRYAERHSDKPYLPDNAYRPYFQKFCPWLSGTWVADSAGSIMNAKIIWACDSTVYPTYDDAIGVLTEISEQSNTITAKNRIAYVVDVLESRKERAKKREGEA